MAGGRPAYAELLAGDLLDESAARIAGAAPRERDAVRRAELDTWQARIEDLIRGRESARKELAEVGARLPLPVPALTWARLAVQAGQVAAGLAAHPIGVRRDFARVARVLLDETPERWTPYSGVATLWVLIDDAGDVHVEPNRRSLLAPAESDGIHAAGLLPGKVAQRLRDSGHRCVALIHGDTWENWRPMLPSNDHAALATARHRDGPTHQFHLWFTRHGLLRPRIRFAPDVRPVVEDAA